MSLEFYKTPSLYDMVINHIVAILISENEDEEIIFQLHESLPKEVVEDIFKRYHWINVWEFLYS